MTKVKHHFINVMATCISFFINYPLKKNHTFGLFLLTYKSSLYFRMIKPKCDINCRKNFFFAYDAATGLQHLKKCLYDFNIISLYDLLIFSYCFPNLSLSHN